MADRPSFVKRLHSALCEAYTWDTLGKMLHLELDVRLESVVKSGAMEIVAHELIVWARRTERITALLNGATRDIPDRADLKQLLADYVQGRASESGLDRGPAPTGGRPSGAGTLPLELVIEMDSLQLIPTLINDSPRQYTVTERGANRIRSLPLEALDLPERLHLSDDMEERLVACLALEKNPDPRYLRWLAERVAVEPPYAAHAAGMALRQAALKARLVDLGRIKAIANDGLSLLAVGSPGIDRSKQLLREVVRIADTRPGQVSPRVGVTFDEYAAALAEAYTVPELSRTTRRGVNVVLERVADTSRSIELCVFYLLEMAAGASWDHALIIATHSDKPNHNRLTAVFQAYASAGLLVDFLETSA